MMQQVVYDGSILVDTFDESKSIIDAIISAVESSDKVEIVKLVDVVLKNNVKINMSLKIFTDVDIASTDANDLAEFVSSTISSATGTSVSKKDVKMNISVE